MPEWWSNLTMPQAIVIATFIYGIFQPSRNFEIPTAWWDGVKLTIIHREEKK